MGNKKNHRMNKNRETSHRLVSLSICLLANALETL